MLRRLGADTLAPRAGGIDLGEYHDAWTFSPDRLTLAIGTFGRTGVRLVDPAALRVVRDIPMPVAAIGIGWITPERIAVLLQRGGVVIVNARDGRIERRWRLSYRLPCRQRRQATTPHGVVFVVASRDDSAIRLIRVDDDAGIRILELPRVQAPSSPQMCGASAFAIDPAGQRALVAGSRGPVAEVDLGSLAVTYPASPKLREKLGQSTDCPTRRDCTGRRTAVWPAAHTLAIGGVNRTERRGARTETPTGIALIDTRTWSGRLIDRSASEVTTTADGTHLTFGGGRSGVRAAALDGTPRWAALQDEKVRSTSVAGNRVYALDAAATATHVLDAATGARISSTATDLGHLDVLTGRTDAGDPVASPEG